jgi:hypothetical protein
MEVYDIQTGMDCMEFSMSKTFLMPQYWLVNVCFVAHAFNVDQCIKMKSDLFVHEKIDLIHFQRILNQLDEINERFGEKGDFEKADVLKITKVFLCKIYWSNDLKQAKQCKDFNGLVKCRSLKNVIRISLQLIPLLIQLCFELFGSAIRSNETLMEILNVIFEAYGMNNLLIEKVV